MQLHRRDVPSLAAEKHVTKAHCGAGGLPLALRHTLVALYSGPEQQADCDPPSKEFWGMMDELSECEICYGKVST